MGVYTHDDSVHGTTRAELSAAALPRTTLRNATRAMNTTVIGLSRGVPPATEQEAEGEVRVVQPAREEA